eukprot:362193-Chlamydomonas_euryale.AAC.3
MPGCHCVHAVVRQATRPQLSATSSIVHTPIHTPATHTDTTCAARLTCRILRSTCPKPEKMLRWRQLSCTFTQQPATTATRLSPRVPAAAAAPCPRSSRGAPRALTPALACRSLAARSG